MIVPMYSIRDKHVGFDYPTPAANEYVAKRNFAAAVNNANPVSGIAFAPGDYDLYHVGFFDTDSGEFSSTDLNVPAFIVNGSSVFAERKER